MKNKLLLLFFILILSPIYSLVSDGVLDLTNYSFKESGILDLSGLWKIQYSDNTTSLIMVPGGWEGEDFKANFKLKIISPEVMELLIAPGQVNSKYWLYCNDNLIAYEDDYNIRIIPIKLNKGVNIIKFEVVNISDPVGGLRETPNIGTVEQIQNKRANGIIRDAFFAGISLIIAIFFIVLFVVYKKETYYIIFSLLCFSLFLRGIVINEKILFILIPWLSGNIAQKIEYFSVYSMPLLFILFLKYYFKDKKSYTFFNIIIAVSCFFPIIVLVLKPILYKSFLFIYFGFAFFTIITLLAFIISYVIRRFNDSVKILISIFTVGCAASSDIIKVIYDNNSFHLQPIAISLFILFMIYNIFINETLKRKRLNRINKDNIEVNLYLSKFVPRGFAKSVGLGDLFSLNRGSGVEKSMTIIFTSIKDFNKKMNVLESEEIMRVLNSVYSIISPAIELYGGFIDKYMDDTLMAIFPGNPENAIEASIEMNRLIDQYNKKDELEYPIKLCTGIHYGSQYIGIVGDNRRLDATVISKVVNTASRILSFSHKIGECILISEDVYSEIVGSEKYNLLFSGNIKLKGSRDYLGIYSIKNDNPSEADKLFSITMKKLKDGTLYDIENTLKTIQRMYGDHNPTNYYLKLIRKNKKLEELDK